MTLPFVFHYRTGELVRDGRAITLNRLHAGIFNAIAFAQTPIGAGAIAKSIGCPRHDIEPAIPGLARKLAKLGIRIASANGRGRWLEFEPIQKWRPTIVPPATIDGERS